MTSYTPARSQCGGATLRALGYELELNTQWLRARWQTRHCDHHWFTFLVDYDHSSHDVCVWCDVHRWWPVISFRPAGSK